jgi:hypothetical protein
MSPNPALKKTRSFYCSGFLISMKVLAYFTVGAIYM